MKYNQSNLLIHYFCVFKVNPEITQNVLKSFWMCLRHLEVPLRHFRYIQDDHRMSYTIWTIFIIYFLSLNIYFYIYVNIYLYIQAKLDSFHISRCFPRKIKSIPDSMKRPNIILDVFERYQGTSQGIILVLMILGNPMLSGIIISQ